MTGSVCILPTFRPGDIGGVARHVQALRKHLPAYGWTVTDRPEAADLVHTHAIERAPAVDVFTCHGIYPILPNMPRWQSDANRAVLDNIKLARRVIAVSEWTAAQWQRLTGVTPRIIPNGIDLDEWQNVERGVWRAMLRIPDGTPLVLWGKTSISDVLDPTPAIEIALRRPDVAVVAPFRSALIPHVPANMHLIGPQPYDQMQRLIADCDVYLATVCENHSIQLLEAMALAKPVLGYYHGGTFETLAGSHAGLLVQSGDLAALVEGLDRVCGNTPMGEAGRALVAERYQWSDVVMALAEVYEEAQAEIAAQAASPVVCSIVIPVYNKAAYVAEAIQSAADQVRAPAFEVVIVDDGSTDDSLAVIRQTVRGVRSDVSVQVIEQKNSGVAAARNAGIKAARGQYIACLDADDRIDPLFLSHLAPALDSDPGLGIAYSDFISFGYSEARGGYWQAHITCSEYDFGALKAGNFMPCCNLFRRVAWERAGGYKDINPSWEDYELWLNMGKLGWPGRRVPLPLFWYRKVDRQGRDFESRNLAWKLRGVVNSYHRDLFPPMVSVVIPCYQHSQYLRDSIGSALGQTFPDLEVIVVDDGNDPDEADDIWTTVISYGSDDVRLVRLPHNSGLATARNAGIDAARGTWIVPLDADDRIEPTFVEACLKASQLDPHRFAYSDSILWWPDTGKEQELDADEYKFADMLNRLTWPCTILYAKSAWREAGGYKPAMSEAGGWEDWEFAVTLGENGVCGVRVPEHLFRYRQHSATQMRHEADRRKPALQEMIRRLHAATYRGEFGMSCCGRQQVLEEPAAARGIQGAMATRSGNGTSADTTVLVRYVGASVGTQTWTAPSGRRYEFGLSDPLRNVYQADALWFTNLPQFQVVPA